MRKRLKKKRSIHITQVNIRFSVLEINLPQREVSSLHTCKSSVNERYWTGRSQTRLKLQLLLRQSQNCGRCHGSGKIPFLSMATRV